MASDLMCGGEDRFTRWSPDQTGTEAGMSYAAARAAVARGGVITAETEHRFTAGRQPVLVRSIGTPAAPPDLSPLPAAERARVAKSVCLTRYYGILGLDDFTLLFDANDRLLSSDLYPVN